MAQAAVHHAAQHVLAEVVGAEHADLWEYGGPAVSFSPYGAKKNGAKIANSMTSTVSQAEREPLLPQRRGRKN